MGMEYYGCVLPERDASKIRQLYFCYFTVNKGVVTRTHSEFEQTTFAVKKTLDDGICFGILGNISSYY